VQGGGSAVSRRSSLIILLFGPDAVLRLIAGIVAIVTRDEKRGDRRLEVLRILRGRDRRPPSP
jgi:hypothetical protein